MGELPCTWFPVHPTTYGPHNRSGGSGKPQIFKQPCVSPLKGGSSSSLWGPPVLVMFVSESHHRHRPTQRWSITIYTDHWRNTGPCTNPCEKTLHLPNNSLLNFDGIFFLSLLWSIIQSTGWTGTISSVASSSCRGSKDEKIWVDVLPLYK